VVDVVSGSSPHSTPQELAALVRKSFVGKSLVRGTRYEEELVESKAALDSLVEQLQAAQKRVSSHYYVSRDYHNDYVGRLEERMAELKEQLEAVERWISGWEHSAQAWIARDLRAALDGAGSTPASESLS